jgi:hypothetical protein
MGARRSWVVSPTLCPLYPQERDSVLINEVGRESGPVWMSPKKLSSPGFEPPNHPPPINPLYELHHPGRLVCLCRNLQTIQIFVYFLSYSVLLVIDWKAPHLGWILGTRFISYAQYKIFSTISVLISPLQRARDPLQHKGLCYRLGFMCSTFSRNGNNTATYFPRLFPFLLDESDRNCIHCLYNVDSNDALCTELTDSISCKWIRLIGKLTIWRWITASLLKTWQSPFLYELNFKNARPKYN